MAIDTAPTKKFMDRMKLSQTKDKSSKFKGSKKDKKSKMKSRLAQTMMDSD